MNKKEMAAKLAEKAEISQVQATAILNALFDADDGILSNTLVAKEKVLLAGFGTVEVKTRKARVGTNPSTKAKLDIAAKNYVSFKPGKTLKERIVG
jgi:DNA-binding protein HU-beta